VEVKFHPFSTPVNVVANRKFVLYRELNPGYLGRGQSLLTLTNSNHTGHSNEENQRLCGKVAQGYLR
jgi:hypothetical protein